MDSDLESTVFRFTSQRTSVIKSTNGGSPDSESKLFSLISQLLLGLESMDWDSDWESKIMPLFIQIISFVRSMDLDALPKPESKLMSLVTQTVSLFNSTDLGSLPNPLSKLISLFSQKISSDSDQEQDHVPDLNFLSLLVETRDLKPYPELISLIYLIFSVVISTYTELEEIPPSLYGQVEGYFDQGKFHVTHDGSWDMEAMLISIISELLALHRVLVPKWEPQIKTLIIRIIGLFKLRDLDAQPKPESKFMSLVSQAISLFNSTDLDSLPEPLSKLISFISKKISIDSDQEQEPDSKFEWLAKETLKLKPDPELVSLIRQILSVVLAISMNPKWKTTMFLCPQVKSHFHGGGKCSVYGEESQGGNQLWDCFLGRFEQFRFKGEEDFTHFHCESCNGEYHKEYERAPLEVKHPLHRKHLLQLALNMSVTRGCYCCDEDIMDVFYLCLACDFALNIACVEKPRVLSIPPSKWHEHSLTLFPRKTSITCDICALDHSNCPIYICSPCDFVAHLKCINLPRVLRISRHLHRICYTPSFGGGDWSCGVCRKKMDNDYGGYSCMRDGCSYAAHSRCATQENIWDGIDLEGEPEEIEEQVAEPFVRICDGIIQHFSHDHHYLRLDENTCRDYDDNKLCQACITPIYFGNLYSCVQCEFVLHETCANLSRKIYHPIHPHLLTLAMRNVRYLTLLELKCTACCRRLITGFFYECDKGGHNFRLHVQCATISEPLVHRSHVHPLFLTSKPEEKRECSVCQRSKFQTFNCIDECDDFALCFACATLPQKLRYTHDKHILTLSYGEETSSKIYWCEACEGKINPKNGFYMCDEYCGTTLHIECLIGKDLYMKPGSWFPGYREQNMANAVAAV